MSPFSIGSAHSKLDTKKNKNTRCYSQRLTVENQKRAVPCESNVAKSSERSTEKKIQKSVCSCSSVMVRRWLRKQTHRRRSLSGFWKLREETAGYEWHETIKSKHKLIILWAQSKSTAWVYRLNWKRRTLTHLSETFKTPQKDNMVNNMLVNPFLI